MSEQDQDLTPTMQELMAEMTRMRAELNSLKERAQAFPYSEPPAKPAISSTRRKILKQLGLALLGGAAVATAVGVPAAQAKLTTNPNIGNQNSKVGIFVTPPGASAPTTTVSSGFYTYGLVATAKTSSFAFSDLPAGSTALTGYGYYGVYGSTNESTGYGVYGIGIGLNTTGVFAYSSTGTAIGAQSAGGIPLYILPSSQPSSGTRRIGDMYVDYGGNLHIYNGTAWRVVTTIPG